MKITLDIDNPLIVAQEFERKLLSDSIAKNKFISDNIDNLIWTVSKLENQLIQNFCMYGPIIPGTDGLMLNLCSIYLYNEIWFYVLSSDKKRPRPEKTCCKNAKEIKEKVEKMIRESYATVRLFAE